MMMDWIVLGSSCILFSLLWIAFLNHRIAYLKESAETYHRCADESLRDLEMARLERDRHHQRAQFLTERLATYEERFGQI